MKKVYCLILLLYLANVCLAQVSEFPQVYYNGQGINGTRLAIHLSASLNNPTNIYLNQTSKIGAVSYVTSTESDGTAIWAQVCLPSNNFTLTYGYMLYGQYYARIDQTNNYATVKTPNLNIRIGPGASSPNVTIDGLDATYSQNAIVALTGKVSNVDGFNWYEVYLPSSCSQLTGWMHGSYLTFPFAQNYYIAAGTVQNSNSVYVWGATVNFGSLASTYSTEGFYQYKLSPGWSGNITCSHPDYSISTPLSYQYTALSHNYNLNFILSNTTCTAPTLYNPTVKSSSKIDLSWSSTGASGYTVYYSSVACNSNTYFTYNTSSTSASIIGLSPNTTYYFWVIANDCNKSSNCVNANTSTSCNLSAPTNLSVSNITDQSFDVSLVFGAWSLTVCN